ncbi:hypothetical protein [Rhodoferax sp.]|uniref:hypothetical protein n=1 Tax=Rhodoferax sp. TaxID=50421 RepID=UPI00261BEC98|nr:hypothetical protein [Rhodoferax sp.]MDD2925423.1 hypothetical protein [Rhodoferax sp.]
MPLALLSSPHFLRHVLRLDALSCAVCGLLQVLVPGQMSTLLALPVALLTYSGEFLLLYAALVAWIASRVPLPRTLVWLLLAGNLAWALGCVLLLVGTGLSPSTLGTAYVLLQALTVLVMAELQFVGLRRAAPAEPAW